MLYRTKDKRFFCIRNGDSRTGDNSDSETLLRDRKYGDFCRAWPWYMLEESTLVVPKEFL